MDKATMTLKTSTDSARTALDSYLGSAQVAESPFPHFAVPALFDDLTAAALIEWLETDARWILESRNFYVQHACGTVTEQLAATAAAFAGSEEALQILRKHLERIFRTKLSPRKFTVFAHRMLPGHRIGVHNDRPANGTETHRLVVNLGREFDDKNGGHLVLFNPSEPAKSAVILRPLHNSAAAMQFSDHSWHCVEEIKAGVRYSLLYSFWSEASEISSEGSEKQEGRVTESVGLSDPELQQLIAVLRDIGANARPHTGRCLIDHLTGTFGILQDWGCDSDVCKAGLFHSVFGTIGFPSSLVPEGRSSIIRDAIGERALKLVELFRRFDLASLLIAIADKKVVEGGEFVGLGAHDVQALVNITWANILEQTPFAPVAAEEIKALRVFHDKTQHMLPERVKTKLEEVLSWLREAD